MCNFNNPIHDATKDHPVALTPEKAKSAGILLNEFIEQLQFLRHCVSAREISKSTVHTHLSLTRSQFEELASLLGTPQFLSGELEERTAMLRDANRRIREMEKSIGKTLDGRTVQAGLRRMEDLFRAWYERAGFHYASITFSSFGLNADFSDELEKKDGRYPHLADQEIYNGLDVPYFGGADADIHQDTYHGSLLDTDRNRTLVMDLFGKYFPGCAVTSFRSHRDRNLWLLRFEVYVPFSNISAMADNCMAQ